MYLLPIGYSCDAPADSFSISTYTSATLATFNLLLNRRRFSLLTSFLVTLDTMQVPVRKFFARVWFNFDEPKSGRKS